MVLAALMWDLSERSTEPYPFAVMDIDRGALLEDHMVEWRDVPVGTMDQPELEGAIALTGIRSGEPLIASLAGAPSPIPEGWWVVPMRLPLHVGTGEEVRLVLGDGEAIAAVVASSATVDEFGADAIGAVAVPAEQAHLVALSSAADAVIVLTHP